jgi:hypothetical protein
MSRLAARHKALPFLKQFDRGSAYAKATARHVTRIKRMDPENIDSSHPRIRAIRARHDEARPGRRRVIRGKYVFSAFRLLRINSYEQRQR